MHIIVITVTLLLCVFEGSGNLILHAPSTRLSAAENDLVTLKWDLNENNNTIVNRDDVLCYVISNGSSKRLGIWTSVNTLNVSDEVIDIFDYRLSGRYMKNGISIALHNLSFTDTGQFFCQYKNESESINLNVDGKPVVINKNLSDSVNLNDNHTFTLILCGNPRPTIFWEYFGKTVEDKGKTLSPQYFLSGSSYKGSLTFCYNYTLIVSSVKSPLCHLELKYTIKGYRTAVAENFSISFLPTIVENVFYDIQEECILVTWDCLVADPYSCYNPVSYSVRFTSFDSLVMQFSSFSTAFRLCSNASLNISSIRKIEVGYNQMNMATKFTLAIKKKLTESYDKETEDYSIAIIALSTTLGIVLLCFITLAVALRYWNYKYNQKIERENRKKKQSISHRPRKLSEVVTNQHHLIKSNTISASSDILNRYTTENNLQKAFMPLNTLQKRIVETLDGSIMDREFYMNKYTELDGESDRPDSTHTEFSYIPPSPNPSHRHQLLSRANSAGSTKSHYSVSQVKLHDVRLNSNSSNRAIYDLPRALQRNLKFPVICNENANDEVKYANSRPVSRRTSMVGEIQSSLDDQIKSCGKERNDNNSSKSHYDKPSNIPIPNSSENNNSSNKSENYQERQYNGHSDSINEQTSMNKNDVDKRQSLHAYATVASVLKEIEVLETSKNLENSSSLESSNSVKNDDSAVNLDSAKFDISK